jgi:hypothetical protein
MSRIPTAYVTKAFPLHSSSLPLLSPQSIYQPHLKRPNTGETQPPRPQPQHPKQPPGSSFFCKTPRHKHPSLAGAISASFASVPPGMCEMREAASVVWRLAQSAEYAECRSADADADADACAGTPPHWREEEAILILHLRPTPPPPTQS